jgi:predicted O-methyltransferase YrrM
MLWSYYIDNIDDSHPMTTNSKHIKMICGLIYDKSISMVEFGSYYGYSTAAFALSSPSSQIISIDLSCHISEHKRVSMWNSLGIKNIIPYTMSTSKFLESNDKYYDVIFHDAIHGAQAYTEYIECIKITDCLIIHDFEQMQTIQQQKIKQYFNNTIEDYDSKGRCLFVGKK